MTTKKIKIYLRHSFYSPNSSSPDRKRPNWFDKKKVWENFLKVTDFTICDLTVVYDSHFGDNSHEFFSDDINIIKINAGNEASSFLKLLDIIQNDKISDDTIVYILEDDYLHRENWYNIIIEGLEISDYVSLYDHLDKYQVYPDLKSKILITESCHWRTTPSTCNTYASKFSTLKEDIQIHINYSTNCHVSFDGAKFTNLGEIGRILITPIPGYSTHCDLLQSPIINWEKYI